MICGVVWKVFCWGNHIWMNILKFPMSLSSNPVGVSFQTDRKGSNIKFTIITQIKFTKIMVEENIS
jgi:hypothetical protein